MKKPSDEQTTTKTQPHQPRKRLTLAEAAAMGPEEYEEHLKKINRRKSQKWRSKNTDKIVKQKA